MPDLPPPLPRVGIETDKIDETPEGTSIFEVTLSIEGRTARFEYRMGSAHTKPPTIHEVLDSVLAETAIFEQTGSFERYCSESGLENNPEAANIYRKVKKLATKVRRLLDGWFDDFMSAYQEGRALQGPNRPMRIVGGGQGQFLAPPMHPAHHYHLEDGPPHNPNLSAGLDYALDPDNTDVPESMRRQVRQLFDEAQLVRSPLWEAHVYGYFRNCYSPDGTSRNVSDCLVPKAGDPVPPPEHHLGYLLVKSYFPDAEPNLALIERSDGYGSRPCRKCGTTLQYEARVDAFAEAISGKRDCPEGGVHET